MKEQEKPNYVSHPKYSREDLHGKELLRLSAGLPIEEGWLSASEPQEDGRYVLTFQAYDFVDPQDLEKSLAKDEREHQERGQIIIPKPRTLDQDEVSKIQGASETALWENYGCDFVLKED